MKEYYVIIKEYLEKTIEVKANSKKEAREIVKQKYDNEEICLDYMDWKDTKYQIIKKEEE